VLPIFNWVLEPDRAKHVIPKVKNIKVPWQLGIPLPVAEFMAASKKAFPDKINHLFTG
jgi:hypothetical protein